MGAHLENAAFQSVWRSSRVTGKWGQSPCQVRLQNRPGQKRLRTGQLDPDIVSLAFPSFFLEKGGDDQGAAAPPTALWGAGGQGTRCADVAPPLGNLSSHTGWSSKPGHCLRLCSVTAASSVEGPEAAVCTVSREPWKHAGLGKRSGFHPGPASHATRLFPPLLHLYV